MVRPIHGVVTAVAVSVVLAGCGPGRQVSQTGSAHNGSAQSPRSAGTAVMTPAPPDPAVSITATTLAAASTGAGQLPAEPAHLDISRRFRPPLGRLLNECPPRGAVLTRPVSGPARGFARCGTTIRYLESTRTGWRSASTQITGSPMAVTDDGQTTFLLYAGPDPSDRSLISVWLLRRDHSGTARRSRLATHLLTASSQEASIVARNGAWWAAWTELNGAGTWVWSAHTLGGTRKAYRSDFQARSPSLLLQGNSVLMAYTSGFRPEGNTIYTAVPAGGGWRRLRGSVSGGAKPYDDVTAHPQLVLVGGTVMVAYLKMVLRKKPSGEFDLVLAERSGKSWTRRMFRTTTAGAPSLLDSGGEPVLAWTAITPKYLGGRGWTAARQEIRLAARRGNRWTTSTMSAPGTFPYLVAMSRHEGALVGIVEDDKGKGLLLHQ